TPDKVTSGSERKVWWRCSKHPDHEWPAQIDSRARDSRGCPRCNKGWTLEASRVFVASLQEHLKTFTPADLYLLFQQNGLFTIYGKGKSFNKALATGRFPAEEIEKFVNGNPSLVDEFVKDPAQTLEALVGEKQKPGSEDSLSQPIDEVVVEVKSEDEQ